MPTLGLIVEDETDEVAISVLAHKCRADLILKTRRSKGTVLGKFRGLASELHRTYRPAKILVVCDADRKSPDQVLRSFKERGINKFTFSVSLIVVVEELEAWLLADPGALRKVLGVSKDFANPERIPDPKRELLRLLPRTMRYSSELARRIAEEIDHKVLAKRCPSFRGFRAAIARV